MLNMFLVWVATGIWHGASWNFIVWGLYYFVLLVIEKNFLLKFLKKCPLAAHIYTLFFVVLGWGIFTANQPGAPLGLLLNKLFVPQGGISPVYYLRNYGVFLVLGCVCSSVLPRLLWERISRNTAVKAVVSALLALLCIAYVVARHQHDGPVRQFLKGGTGSWEKLYTAKKKKSRSPYPLPILGAVVRVWVFAGESGVSQARPAGTGKTARPRSCRRSAFRHCWTAAGRAGLPAGCRTSLPCVMSGSTPSARRTKSFFQKVEEGGILLGKDHWMFTKLFTVDDATQKQLAKNVQAVSDFAAAHPGKVTFLLAPSASVIYPEELPAGAPDGGRERDAGRYFYYGWSKCQRVGPAPHLYRRQEQERVPVL